MRACPPTAMPGKSVADAWVRTTIAELARQHFPDRGRPLESMIRRLAERHETVWRSSSQGVFRPTPAMYALALRWELERRGPSCAVCKSSVELPTGRAPSGAFSPTLALGVRAAAGLGSLNVPQNLALCHTGCLPSR